MRVLYELARMGRHVRTGLLLSSQSPADLDRSVLKRLQTRFVFALERDQLTAIGGIQADLGEELLARLPKLPRGVCAVTVAVRRTGSSRASSPKKSPGPTVASCWPPRVSSRWPGTGPRVRMTRGFRSRFRFRRERNEEAKGREMGVGKGERQKEEQHGSQTVIL